MTMRRSPYRQARRTVFGCTLAVAVGVLTWAGLFQGVGAVRGGPAATEPASGAAGEATTTVSGAGTTTTVGGSGTSVTTRPAAGAQAPGRLAGVWEGEALQRSNQMSWTISMALQPAEHGRVAGIIAYPSLACGGS
jgi:hypothetical protein